MKTVFYLFFVSTIIIYSQSINNIMESNEIDSTKFTIENCVNEFNIVKIVKKEVGYQYWFVDEDFIDGRTLKMSVIKPNSQTHKPHFHIEDEFFFVFEGKAEFYLNGKTKTVEKLSTFYCPKNSIHGIKNVGDTELKYLVIKKIK